MNIQSQKDFFSGLMFMGVGGAFAWGATNYTIGTSAKMGAGYFPLMLGILMALIGLVIAVKATTVPTADGDKIGKWAWRPLIFILLANFSFGVLLAGLPSFGIPAMGMIAAIYALTFIASLARETFDTKEVFFLASALAAGSYVAFIWALKLQIQVWPTFITG